MMDISSMIDAGLALGGAMAVVSSDSTTVSTSSDETGRQSDDTQYPSLQAAA